jgi:predicted nuclease with TOPRIM domain
MDRIGKYEDLNKKYMELESRLTGIAKEKSERKGFEAVKVELAVKKNEIKVMRIKLDKKREKVKYLDKKLAAMKKKTQGSNRRQQRCFEQNQYVAHRKDDQDG